jgi:cytochrome c
MKPYVAVIAAMFPLAVTPALAGPELASKHYCMTCHDMEKQKMGPSFKAIATQYKMGLGCEKEDASAKLTEGILEGSKGKWGKIPMPPQKIPPADAQALSKWILGC